MWKRGILYFCHKNCPQKCQQKGGGVDQWEERELVMWEPIRANKNCSWWRKQTYRQTSQLKDYIGQAGQFNDFFLIFLLPIYFSFSMDLKSVNSWFLLTFLVFFFFFYKLVVWGGNISEKKNIFKLEVKKMTWGPGVKIFTG